MKKRQLKRWLLTALAAMTVFSAPAAVPAYDAAVAKASAQADFANWMKYLPDDVFVAHVSIPGTHDTATAEGWKSLTGSTMSTTQEKTIEEQLAGGIRAFDFRPGMVNGELWCNHGTDQTSLKLADAFAKLKNYLKEHPSEFYVMHLFRGNIFRSGEADFGNKLIGAKDDTSSQNQYNLLFNKLFNEGEYADMFVEYSPRLTVRDVRGKCVVFRRDRINFAHVYNAGNLSNWPGAEEMWTENSLVSVSLDSDPTVKGVLRATDVSSPDNATELETELNSIKGLFEWQCNQTLPNDAKRNGIYKPDWSMIFTSGAYEGENTSGYKKNAAQTNPYLINLIKNATKKGPTGIVLSDWVLTDNYDAHGVELVPTIVYNNFDYISDYILDDELFAKSDAENFWEDGKEYFLRNVGTGEFLTAGATWGSRAALNEDALPVKFEFDDAEGTYKIKTTLGSNNGLGWDDAGYFMDWGNLETFTVERVSAGKFCFKIANSNGTQALGAISVSDDIETMKKHNVSLPYVDGTMHVAHPIAYDKSDPMQQWEVINVEDIFATETAKGSYKTPADVSFMYKIKGHKFAPGESSWSTTTNNNGDGVWSSIGSEAWINSPNDKQCLLHCTNTTAKGGIYKPTNSYTVWKINKTFTLNKAGKYKIRFKTTSNFNYNDTKDFPLTFKINGNDMISKLKSTRSDYSKADEVINAFKSEPEKYTVELDLDLGDDASITFDIQKAKTNSVTHFWMDDVELLYYGTDPTKRYVVLVRAIADGKRRLAEMSQNIPGISENSIDFSVYEEGMYNNAYSGQGEEPALEIYEKLRELTYTQKPDNSENAHQDYSNALINAGFETGTMMGWETSYEGETDVDTGVRKATGDYAMSSNQNDFLFNAAQADPDPENKARGVILSQTIPNLPAGHYILTAEASNDPGNCIYVTVNGQKSDAIVLSGNDKSGEMIKFEFECAENTEEVTISFMGGNSDGSFDEFGGNWYKLDDVHLYRTGEADLCVFFTRLLEAVNRADVIANTTLPDYYKKQWATEEYRTKISRMINTHIQSGHKNGDLNGSNGLEERTELFDHLSQVVLSQAETEANMSGAIRNNSFELGDLSYWNTIASPIATNLVTNGKYADENKTPMEDFYQVGEKDGNYIYYSKLPEDVANPAGNGESYPIYQSISGLPAGEYELSVLIASTPGNKFFLAGNNASEMITAESDKNFQKATVKFTIATDNSDLLLGLYPSADGTFISQEANAEVKGPWFAIDNFELHLVGRQKSIEWTMETPTHGTIILPFIPDETPEDLEFYSLKYNEDAIAEGATHKILVYEKHETIEANTPYIVMLAGQDAPMSVKKAKFKAAKTGEAECPTYTFTGFTTNTKMAYEDGEYKDGVLTGVMVPTEADNTQYHLQSYEDNVGFVLHQEGPEDGHAVEPYHAFITLSEDENQTENIHGLYFEEPTLPLTWEMEGDYYGTIMLPFAAELPAESKMKAYKIQSLDDAKDFYITEEGAQNKYTYQLMHLDEGTTDLEANTPYFVIKDEAMEAVKAAQEAQNQEVVAAAKSVRPMAADGEEEEEVNPRLLTFKGIAAYKQPSYSANGMTGVHHETAIDMNDAKIYTLEEDADSKTGYFVSNEYNRVESVGANHAYITTNSTTPAHFMVLVAPESEDPDNPTGIDEILAGEENVDIYTLQGVRVAHDVVAAEGLRDLEPGIYIIRTQKSSVKVIKK